MAIIMNGKFAGERHIRDEHTVTTWVERQELVKVHMAGNGLLVIEEGDDSIMISPEAALWLMDWLQQHAELLRES